MSILIGKAIEAICTVAAMWLFTKPVNAKADREKR